MAYQPHDRGADHYRPNYRRDDGPPPPPPGIFQFRGAASRDSKDFNGRPDFTFRARTKISDRPLLKTRRGSKEEEMLGVTNAHGDKFRNLDELTDSDEADMEDSEEEDNEEEDCSSNKRARLEDTAEKPKWSNPDVYTSLPAPSETTGKKLDFVKLIRKARNTDAQSTDPAANDEDFISFGDFDDAPPLDAPTGPKIQNNDMTLGKRKRGENTGTKLISKRGTRFYQDGMVLDEWRPKEGIHPTPWLQMHDDRNAGLALHKEILDFYEWVRPRDYEFEVRAGVLKRLSAALNRIEPGELKAFGSYAAGLYLPTGDMDLVYLPRGFNQRRGLQVGISRNQFHKYGDFIKRSGLAQSNSVTLIGRAKVPIIKFIEKISGLKIDLSFNNDTGVVAIDTFQKWKDQHPAMPILVSVVKQFLMIRGLNDVAVGGLGGFSTICLVTCILQHLPATGQMRNLGEALVEFFNVFGNLFDRDAVCVRLDPPGYIDKKKYAPFLASREKASRLCIIDPNRPDNNISGGTHEIETISTCFSRAYDVLQNRLVDFHNHNPSSGHGFSFLEELVGGNFGAYQVQRDILYGLHHGHTGPAPSVVPPPPPPPMTRDLPPPPPPPPSKSTQPRQQVAKVARDNSTSSTPNDDQPSSRKGSSKKLTKAERRAIRMKNLRPDLASSIGKSVSLENAVKIGGYRDYNEMDRDLTRREHEANVHEES